MISKRIRLPIYEMVINLHSEGDVEIKSNFGTGNTKKFKQVVDGIELLVLSHFRSGIDIQNPLYIKGISDSVESAKMLYN